MAKSLEHDLAACLAAFEGGMGALEIGGVDRPLMFAEPGANRSGHPDDRAGVTRALESVTAREVEQHKYRIIRPADDGVRWLRDTSFPICDDQGAITRIGGIVEDLTRDESRQVYVVSARAAEARRLAGLVRTIDYYARIFEDAAAFLDIAPVPGLRESGGAGRAPTLSGLVVRVTGPRSGHILPRSGA